MMLDPLERARAVYFFDDKKIVGQLLYSEFESILDAYVPAKEWANRLVEAAYVEFNHHFHIAAAVFFKVQFDASGWVTQDWNLPLMALARAGSEGPNLGAGAIQLVSALQCPSPQFSAYLWNPRVQGKITHFTLLKKAVERNALGVCFHTGNDTKDASSHPLAHHSASITPEALEAIERRLASELTRHFGAQKAHSLQQAMQGRGEANRTEEWAQLQTQLAQQNQQIKSLEAALAQAQQALAQQALTQAAPAAGAVSAASVEDHILEATQEFAELLQRKEVELMIQQEKLDRAIHKLQQQDTQINHTATALLDEMAAAGLHFVTYQFACGPVTIAPADLNAYTKDPAQFIAARYGVSAAHYQAWLQHYQMPLCLSAQAEGNPCGTPLVRTLEPSHFTPGISDRCTHHSHAVKVQ